LLDGAAEGTRLHGQVRRGEVETRVFLRGRAVVGVRVDVRVLTPGTYGGRGRRGGAGEGGVVLIVRHHLEVRSSPRQVVAEANEASMVRRVVESE